jgi:hypothetical protein
MAEHPDLPADEARAPSGVVAGMDRRPALAPRPGAPNYYGEYDANGVDLSLLRYLLQLSPLERLRLMERHARDTQALYDYGRRHREAQAGRDR